jgi:hypothetical protein
LKMFQQSLRLIEQESSSQRNRPTSAASVLRLSNRRKSIHSENKKNLFFFSSKYPS